MISRELILKCYISPHNALNETTADTQMEYK